MIACKSIAFLVIPVWRVARIACTDHRNKVYHTRRSNGEAFHNISLSAFAGYKTDKSPLKSLSSHEELEKVDQ
jgi:hypothetical protein